MTDIRSRYDKFADVLYLSLEDDVPAWATEDDRGILWRHRMDNGNPVGATILDFHEVWSGRVSELADTISSGLKIAHNRATRALRSTDG